MPISTRRSPTSVGVEPSSRCVRPSTQRRRHRGPAMITKTPNLNRRSFVIGSAAVGAGLALGLKIPFGASVVRAQDGSPEVTAWVVIRPDDTVVIRIARSEMGQGTLTPPEKPALKDPTEWKLIGKSVKRLDTMDKLSGAQVYGTDLKLPGMLNATIKDCPVFGGKVKSYEAAKVTGMPGVRHVVKVGDSAVAVVEIGRAHV